MPRGKGKKKGEDITKLIGTAITAEDIRKNLTSTAFINAYIVFGELKAEKSIVYTAVINGETFELIFSKK